MHPTLNVGLADTPHRGPVASAVVLGVAVSAGLTPLAADRAARAVGEACGLVAGPVDVAVEPAAGGGALLTLRRAAGAWPEPAMRALTGLGPADCGTELRMVLRRAELRAVGPDV